MGDIRKLIDRMTYWCRDANLGYDQTDRWNFDPAGGNCDCSSLVIHCLREAGFDTGTAGYTGNLSVNLTARGWARLPPNGNPEPGDILLNDTHHVAVSLGGGLLAQASISENNTITGTAGDQTGGETNISNYYNYPWDCYLRWEGDDMPSAQEIAEAVWNFNQNGTIMRDRIQGIDQAANNIVQTVGERVWSFGVNKTQARDRLQGIDSIQLPAISGQITQLAATVTALQAALDTLAKSIGADPDQIAITVETAVKAKLDALQIDITATNKEE